ncbi:MAG: aminoacyl-tRNA hydrolase [Myxococcota bacterium]
MLLVVGLGNPGEQYVRNRHNIGFQALDGLAEKHQVVFRDKFRGLFAKVSSESLGDFALLKPMTFMNLSGESVQAASRFFKLRVDRVLVVHDELDLPFGELRLKTGGGFAGHNGLKSIGSHLDSGAFHRLRVGVGRPVGARRPRDWLLSDFSALERAELPEILTKVAAVFETVAKEGMSAAMNRHHGKS